MLVLAGVPYGQAAEQVPPIPVQEQPEVLTRGPVHEAYAEPVDLQLQAGVVAPKQPPANIQEAPTTQMPQGGNFVWVPGYWSWDADRNDYIWVSACWRAAPPGMSWVPGYWAQVSNGWEWVAGFWTPAGTKEIEYLPQPPDLGSVEAPGPAPSPDYIWVPPCQYWYNDRFVLRAGYWLEPQPNWVWVPSHYIWTPRGYVFVEGHWDYLFSNRGILFAPVYFARPVYFRSAFVFSPSIVLDIGAVEISLFTYPRYCHYFFGDYYDDVYVRVGIYPWFECERYHTWYDPIYFHDRWRFRHSEPHWAEQQRHQYDIRRSDRDLRPARTYREMEMRVAKAPKKQRKDLRIAEPFTTYAKTSRVKFERIDTKTQQKFVTQGTEVHKFQDQRRGWESTAGVPKRGELPSVERQASVPIQPSQRATTTPEPKVPEVTPPVQQRGPVTAKPERKAPEVTPPVERKVPATTTPEHKAAVTGPVERKQEMTKPSEGRPEFVPPRQVHATRPERIRIPESSVVGRPGAAEKGPPQRPASERKDRDGMRETGRGEVMETPRGQEEKKD
jgi:hypothetical protein